MPARSLPSASTAGTRAGKTRPEPRRLDRDDAARPLRAAIGPDGLVPHGREADPGHGRPAGRLGRSERAVGDERVPARRGLDALGDPLVERVDEGADRRAEVVGVRGVEPVAAGRSRPRSGEARRGRAARRRRGRRGSCRGGGGRACRTGRCASARPRGSSTRRPSPRGRSSGPSRSPRRGRGGRSSRRSRDRSRARRRTGSRRRGSGRSSAGGCPARPGRSGG